MFKATEWELSTVTATSTADRSPLSPGIHHLYIESASFNPETGQYALTLSSLDRDDEVSTVKYFVFSKDGTLNNRAVGTLNSLTEAILGRREGILIPKDVTHGVVLAEVKLSKPKEYNGEMRQYPQIYEFSPVTRGYLDTISEVTVTIDQYAKED